MRLVEEYKENININESNEMLNYQGNPETISAFATYEKNRKKKTNKKTDLDEMNKKKRSWMQAFSKPQLLAEIFYYIKILIIIIIV